MDYQSIFNRALVVGLLVLAAFAAHATTIRQVGTTQLVNESELVFEARVQDRWSAYKDGTIVTYVLFEVIDVVKGDLDGNTLTLQFLGGEVDGQGLEIAASNIPQLGEHGVYFVESTTVALVNPLYGWQQGQFVVEDEGVYTADKQPVTEFSGQLGPEEMVISTSQALGVTTNGTAKASPLTLNRFKDKIRGLIVEQVEDGE